MNKIFVYDHTVEIVKFKSGDLFIDKSNEKEVYILINAGAYDITEKGTRINWKLCDLLSGNIMYEMTSYEFEIPKRLENIVFLGRDLEIIIHKKK
jgi:hypothetical protein